MGRFRPLGMNAPHRGLLAAALAALACASGGGGQPVTRTANVIRIVCEDEPPVGSHLPVQRCRLQDQSERERDALQRELLRPRANTPFR